MRRAAAALLILPLLAACRAEPPAAQASAPPPPRPVQVAEVVLAPAESRVAYTGTVRARREVEVGFRTGGRIAARLVEVGQVVAEGQELARIDPADLALALRSADADLAAAEAQSRQAANDAARSRALLRAGHVAAAFDDQRQAAASAAAERVASAQAALELARNRLSYATLRAPSAGVVTALLAEAGQVVPEGDAVLRLADPSERELVVRVPESALPELREAAAEARFWARPDAPLATALRELAPQADGALRTYAARFSLPDAPDWVALGMTGTVRLARDAGMVATLPLGALHDRGQGPMVWRVAGERIEAVPVRVTALGEAIVQVAGALQPGEKVVALGPQLLDPESRVRVVSTRLAATLR
ncbi:efflux RND transporter periplasmic adaptor subunit [Falsiroseomonas bella]|uniref:Efflux RND transporter periplasmic adaptor subunit n=1 Tax=Falsiroseomonas bella TaxID=2184016 RepID=A0A317FFP5_9PROT|nr:efflux RND transporter periplasmic adaptor subunit [Falsiroseomonas bella]PWS37900.1 efflux RND transporter periplasmic adaptor subunit [Falsiroseomonas bella]